MRMTLARDNIEGIRTAEDDTSFVGAPFKLTFGNVARETLRLAKVERLPFVHDELAEGFAVEAGVPDLRVVLGRIQDLCSGLGLPRLPAVIVRSDDDMSEIGFYELYRVLIYPRASRDACGQNARCATEAASRSPGGARRLEASP